jgi:hypothetical protein
MLDGKFANDLRRRVSRLVDLRRRGGHYPYFEYEGMFHFSDMEKVVVFRPWT